jgi:hypothetical protein
MHSASCGAGRLTELCRDEGGGLSVTDAYRQVNWPANTKRIKLLLHVHVHVIALWLVSC